jgi:hypothetical protein
MVQAEKITEAVVNMLVAGGLTFTSFCVAAKKSSEQSEKELKATMKATVADAEKELALARDEARETKVRSSVCAPRLISLSQNRLRWSAMCSMVTRPTNPTCCQQ